MIKEKMDASDLNEMLGMCYASEDAGFQKIQLNTEHAIEILERLIALLPKEAH